MNTGEINLIRDNSDGYRGAIANAKRYNKEPEKSLDQRLRRDGQKDGHRKDLQKVPPPSAQKAFEIDAQVNAGVHVSMDKDGDVVIEHEAQPDADARGSKRGSGRARQADREAIRFEQMYGAVHR